MDSAEFASRRYIGHMRIFVSLVFQGLYLCPLGHPLDLRTLVKLGYSISYFEGTTLAPTKRPNCSKNKIIFNILQIGNGMLRALHYEPGAVAGIIPVDLVVNMILAAT